jgi:NADH:ubiquinone reductase (H+-translocating)
VSPEPGASARRQVVVVGGGFGGFAAARALRHADVNVTLVDRTNHHLFQPLLYQAAAGALSEGECAATIRGMLRRQGNATLLMASVTAIDADAHQVTLDSGESLD